MVNNFKYSDSNKRYHTLDYYYRNKYNSKVCKISLNAGFTCPNLDGTKGFGGCIYCSKLGSGEFGGDVKKSLDEQFKEVKKIYEKKWPNAKYIAYLQARTNTYGNIDKLKDVYETVLSNKEIIGLNIATRPDSITDECLDYLTEINKRTDLVIELGLQTIHEKTAKLINRCYELNVFTDMVKKLKERNIYTVVHIINGLPGETKEDMIETVKFLNKLSIDGIKIHMLSILKNTELEKLFKKEKFHILTKDEYIDIVVEQLEHLDEKIVINRITGDPKIDDLIEPTWLTKKFVVLNDIDKEMVKRDTYQGTKVE